jgi:hypothetical protein
MPVSDNLANFKRLRRLGSNPDKDKCGSQNRDGRHRVHHDAQGAAVDIPGGRMRNRYMDNRQQHQQNQAHHDRQSQSTRPSMAIIW